MSSNMSNGSSSGSAILTLLHLANTLEDATTSLDGSYVTTKTRQDEDVSVSNTWYTYSHYSLPSQVTVRPNESASQVTMPASALGGDFPAGVATQSSTKRSTGSFKGEGKLPGGLEKDKEGVETRKQMLERRRKECKADEVSVALAPVLKIQVPYAFYPEQFTTFRQLFPRVSVDSGLAFTHHDHPVAHTATMVGIRRVQGMLKSGELALDLGGNPNGNEQYNRFQQSRVKKRPNLPEPPVIESLVKIQTAMDFVRRVTKWGPQYDKDGNQRWIEGDLKDVEPGKYDAFTMFHTLYYYTMYQIADFLGKNPKARIHALVNYSPEQSGRLYGELDFHKAGGMTTQISPNGERYEHPDIDQWFQMSSFRGLTQTIDSGISWTSTCIGGPLYVITITRCDWDMARYTRYDPPQAPTLQVSGDRSLFGILRIGGKDVRLRITNAALAKTLRHWMVYRDRTDPQVFTDLALHARRITSEDRVKGTQDYSVNDGELQDHVAYAFCVDAPGELELLEGVKLLRGDLFYKHAEALKLQGSDKLTPWLEVFLSGIFGRSEPKKAIGSRDKPAGAGIFHKKQNTGGLLPTKRT